MRRELSTLSKENADGVAAHLVMVDRLLDFDLDAARAHAEVAVRRGGRIPAVREARGVVAYREGEWALALSEFRTARRLSGSNHLLPLMVDCERGLGRLDRALDLATSPEAGTLSAADQVELRIVVSGIRRDLDQPEAALAALRIPQLVAGRSDHWAARLYYAYAEALLATGDEEAARTWFGHAVSADENLRTDAAERLDDLDGVVLVDLMEDDEEGPDDGEDAARSEGEDRGEGEDRREDGPVAVGADQGPADGAEATESAVDELAAADHRAATHTVAETDEVPVVEEPLGEDTAVAAQTPAEKGDPAP